MPRGAQPSSLTFPDAPGLLSSIMKTSRYNVIHALVAMVVMILAVSQNFWHNFLHGGFPEPPPADVVHKALGGQFALFGTLLLVLWASTLFIRRQPAADSGKQSRIHVVRFTLCACIPTFLAAFALMFASNAILEKCLDIKAAGQDLVQWLQPGTYPLSTRLMLMAFALFEAPLLEEPIFRGVMFRGLAKSMPIWAAMTASGFVFALIHVNAASFIPLWFLGCVFAWLYCRTGSILAPITAHFMFNLLNLVLVLMGIAT